MRWGAIASRVIAVLAVAGCGGTLDAGRDVPHGLLPVDERNPIILENDGWTDNWSGEYAALLANHGGPPVLGIIAIGTQFWTDPKANAAGWNTLVDAARAGGLTNIGDVTMSTGMPLVKPADGQIDSTTPNHSAGAQLIVDLSRQYSTPSRPVAVVVASPLTDCADAYLIDHTVVDRVVVIAALGSYSAPNGIMGGPNGGMDAWSDWIVAQRFRYVHVGVWYDQTVDVTTAQIPNLPKNPFGDWMAAKQPKVFNIITASDQVAGLSASMPGFVLGVSRAVPDISAGFDPMKGLPLVPHDGGNAWVVTQIASSMAASHLWQWLNP